MLVELAIGDAYGAGFEYAPAPFILGKNLLERYVQHPKHLGILPGAYTDDTQMSIAIAELLVSGKGWTPENIADSFVRVFKRDPRDGYAQGFFQFLSQTTDGMILPRFGGRFDYAAGRWRMATVS